MGKGELQLVILCLYLFIFTSIHGKHDELDGIMRIFRNHPPLLGDLDETSCTTILTLIGHLFPVSLGRVAILSEIQCNTNFE